jgi:hypothetical protein
MCATGRIASVPCAVAEYVTFGFAEQGSGRHLERGGAVNTSQWSTAAMCARRQGGEQQYREEQHFRSATESRDEGTT